jgi:hypothetical protein
VINFESLPMFWTDKAAPEEIAAGSCDVISLKHDISRGAFTGAAVNQGRWPAAGVERVGAVATKGKRRNVGPLIRQSSKGR